MSKSASLPRIRSKARPASQRPRLVEHELERAQMRIRTVDSVYSICLLAGGLLTYLLVVIALDYWLRLGDGTRQMLWGIAGLGALAFVGLRIVYPMIQQINPYYTARMIERATPGSRNGIINWLDLRDSTSSPIIRDALSRRAVHELDSANMEEAIPTRKPIRTGMVIGGILLAIITFAFFLPDQVGSLFKRALFPFKAAIIPTHTRLEVISPIAEPVPEADVDTLPLKEVQVERGQPVEFRVITHGQPPAEVLFESQTAGDKQPIVKPMRQDKKGDHTQPWRVALSSSDIPVDGFEFRFRANDGLTRKFKLIVTSRTPPSVSDLDVRLNYPAYTKRRAASQGMGPIKAIEGTKVDILVTADRAASSGELEVIEEQTADDGKIIPIRRQTIKLIRPAGISDDNKLALAEPLWLIPGYFSKDDKKQKFFYQLALVNPENLTGISPKYPLEVIPDLAPRVEIKKVKDIVLDKKQDEFEVESNAVVPIAGQAHDDIAMGQVSLKLKTSDGRDLFFIGQAPEEKNLQKANGFTPPAVNFLLTLDLAKLTFDDNAATAKPITLKPGTIVEAVVEGHDTAEPKNHTGTSQLIKFKIKGEASKEERQNQEKQAGDQQQQHDQQKKDREQQQPENQQDKSEDKSEDKGDKASNEKGDKASSEKGDKSSNEKGDKSSNEKGDKSSSEKGDKSSNEKGDKSSSEKGDKSSNEKGDKASSEKGDKSSNEKGDKSSSEKGDKSSNEKGDKSSSEKGDKSSNEKGDKSSNEKGDKSSNEKGDKSSSEKGDKSSNEKGDKSSNEKGDKSSNEKGDKSSNEKGDKSSNEKGDKSSSEKGDKSSNEKGDKSSSEKGDKSSNEKGDKSSSEKGDKSSSEKGDKSSNEKGDKSSNEKGDKSSNEKGDKSSNEKGDKSSNEKGDKSSNEKGDKSSNEKGDKSSNEKGDKSSNEKGDKASNEKGDKASNEKGDKSSNEKGDKSSSEKGDKSSNEKGDKSSNEKGEKASNEKGDKASNEKGDKSSNEKGDKSSNEKGDKASNEKGEKASNEKGDKSSNEKGDKASNEKGDKSSNEKDDQSGNDKGKAGGGNGKEPDDKGDLSKLMEQVAKGEPEKSKFNPKAAETKGDKNAPQAVDEEAARKRDLALDTLAEKLRRGDVDRQLADKLKELKLSKEEALKMVQNKKLDRVKATGRAADQGPDRALTGIKQRTEQSIDPATNVPDELASSYRTFTEKRNQPKK